MALIRQATLIIPIILIRCEYIHIDTIYIIIILKMIQFFAHFKLFYINNIFIYYLLLIYYTRRKFIFFGHFLQCTSYILGFTVFIITV